MNDDVSELIRELAVEHGVALDRSDPIVVLHSAMRIIVLRLAEQAQEAQADVLAHHRAELEVYAAKWRADLQLSTSRAMGDVEATIKTTLARELDAAARDATARLGDVLDRHERSISRAATTCALSAAVALVAAGVCVWALGG